MNQKRAESDKVKRALINAQNIIRKKFRQLHNQRLNFNYQVNEEYKPITGQLKKLVAKSTGAAAAAEIKKENGAEIKKEERRLKRPRPISTIRTAKGRRRAKFARFHTAKGRVDDFFTPEQSEDEENEEEEQQQEEVGAAGGEKADISGIEAIEKSDDESVNPLLLAGNDEHAPRMQLNVSDAKSTEQRLLRAILKKRDAKALYGLRAARNRLALGRELVKVGGEEPNLTYEVNGRSFPITPGLTHLLSETIPIDGQYTQNDVEVYKEMLVWTHAHRKGHNPSGAIQRHIATPKYNRIIKPLFPPRRRNTITGDGIAKLIQRGGGGCMEKPQLNYKTVNKVGKINYTYWDDPNELVGRLRILIASKSVGHTGHENEIISIVEELREAKIIK